MNNNEKWIIGILCSASGVIASECAGQNCNDGQPKMGI